MEEAPGPSGRGVPMTSRGPGGQDADTGGGGAPGVFTGWEGGALPW